LDSLPEHEAVIVIHWAAEKVASYLRLQEAAANGDDIFADAAVQLKESRGGLGAQHLFADDPQQQKVVDEEVGRGGRGIVGQPPQQTGPTEEQPPGQVIRKGFSTELLLSKKPLASRVPSRFRS